MITKGQQLDEIYDRTKIIMKYCEELIEFKSYAEERLNNSDIDIANLKSDVLAIKVKVDRMEINIGKIMAHLGIPEQREGVVV